MKIIQTQIKGPLSQPTANRGVKSNSGKAATSAQYAQAGAASSVALSSTARHLANLSNPEGDINIVKVNEIRQALKDGTLVINPERIADGLLDSARELIGTNK